MAFTIRIKHWHAVAEWTWSEGDDDVCGICRTAYDGCAPDVKYPGDDSPVVWGACGHAFHLQCIQKWLASSAEQRCPMCRRTWNYKSAGEDGQQDDADEQGTPSSREGGSAEQGLEQEQEEAGGQSEQDIEGDELEADFADTGYEIYGSAQSPSGSGSDQGQPEHMARRREYQDWAQPMEPPSGPGSLPRDNSPGAQELPPAFRGPGVRSVRRSQGHDDDEEEEEEGVGGRGWQGQGGARGFRRFDLGSEDGEPAGGMAVETSDSHDDSLGRPRDLSFDF